MPFLGRLHDLIRTCQFTAFWKELEAESEGAASESQEIASLSLSKNTCYVNVQLSCEHGLDASSLLLWQPGANQAAIGL
jgi:hypothetical protein